MAADPKRISYSIVIPVFNEEAVLPVLLRRLDLLLGRLDGPAEAIFVDDGSRDSGPIVLQALARRDPRFRFIGLSRNFGHQVAISAGMDAAQGDAVVVMDADLQDPPEVVDEMIAQWKKGYEVVYARRLSRAGESRFKRWTAHLFYRLLGRMSSVGIPADVGDFRLIDRKVLDALRQMPEQDRFVRGMIAWLGFKQTEVTFHRLERVAGETKYPLFKMARLAVNGALGFSDAPLRLAIWCGCGVGVRAMLRRLRAVFVAEQLQRSGARLDVDHHHRLALVRDQHAADRHCRALRWPHPCRGEAPPALCRVDAHRLRPGREGAPRHPRRARIAISPDDLPARRGISYFAGGGTRRLCTTATSSA